MRLLNTAIMPLLIALLVMGAFAVQAQESPPTFVEEGSLALDIPSDLASPAETSALGYKITTSKDDPSCDTGFNGYVNLEDHGISVSARVPGGDNFAIGPFFNHIGPIDYYGHQYSGLYLTDDGFIVFDPVTYSNKVWNPQLIPDTTGPNGLAAILWQDMKLVYDRAANHGVSLGSAADGSVLVVEFDDVRLANAPAHRYDIEMVMRRKVSHAPGDYEIVFAYDNLNGTLAGPLTVGLEDETGSAGVALVNRESAKDIISDGFMICFDAVSGTPPSSTPAAIEASDGTYEDKIQVTWSDVSQAASYDVYRGDANGNGEMKVGTADNTLFNDVSAMAGVRYSYRVKACNAYGCSHPSDDDTGWRADDENTPPPPEQRLFDFSTFIPLSMTR